MGWQACQSIAECPPHDFAGRKTLWINELKAKMLKFIIANWFNVSVSGYFLLLSELLQKQLKIYTLDRLCKVHCPTNIKIGKI